MDTIADEELLAAIKEQEVVRLCSDLVRFETVNPPGDERESAEYVAEFLRRAGFSVELLAHTATRASVLARLPGTGDVPGLLYSGHLDVVPVGAQEWAYDPFQGQVAEGRLWGRGATDMKGGDAAMLVAAGVLAAADLPLQGDLILAFTAGEEGEQLGAAEVAERLASTPLQAVVVAEPSDNDVYVAEKGAFWLKITTHGKTAHGSMPHHGRNAITMMMELLAGLASLETPYQQHPLLGGFTRSVDTIQGGVKTNVVPDECTVTIDQRTVPGQDHETVLSQIRTLVADLSRRIPEFRASVEVINDLVPVETSPDEPVVRRFCDVVAGVTGQQPEPKGVNYYTDAAVLVPALQAPLIICGPGQPDLAHQPNEYVDVRKLVDGAKIFTLAAAELLR